MKIRRTWTAILLAFVGAAWADEQPASTIDGGGEHSSNALRQINGTIGGLAMLSGRGPDIQSPVRRIIPGFYGAAEGRRPLFTGADPAWLELADLPQGAIAPRPVPERLHACELWSPGRFNFQRTIQPPVRPL